MVDPRILPMNRISVDALQLVLGAAFRLLDVDPAVRSFVDVVDGFSVTFSDLPDVAQTRSISDAVVSIYRSGFLFPVSDVSRKTDQCEERLD